METINYLNYPPISFLIILAVVLLAAKLLKSFEPRVKLTDDKTKTYACGEDFPSEKITPSYEEFYPYAILFTVLHVVALMIMTLSFSESVNFAIPLIYSLIVAIILSIIFIVR